MGMLKEILLGFMFLYTVNASSCGTSYGGTQLYCFTGYHCCNEVLNTCCPYGTICISGDTACLSIGVIIGPIVGVIAIAICVVICCVVQKRRARQANQGTVMQPGVAMQPGQQQQQPYAVPPQNQQYPPYQPYPGQQQYGQK